MFGRDLKKEEKRYSVPVRNTKKGIPYLYGIPLQFEKYSVPVRNTLVGIPYGYGIPFFIFV